MASDVQDCSCGFLDSSNGEVYTDATIVYFNETDSLGEDFFVQSYKHKYEYGWNTLYRSGAMPDNVMIGNSTYASSNWDHQSLQLWINPSAEYHLVNGSSIESLRQDMLYGSIRAFMRPAEPWTG